MVKINHRDKIKEEKNNEFICCPGKKIDKKSSMVVEGRKRDNRSTEIYLKFHSKNSDFLMENIRIDLFIKDDLIVPKSRRNQTLLLCQHAVLSLIDPSEKSSVNYHNDLPNLIDNYLKNNSRFYSHDSNYSDDSIIAVLILNQWTKLLVKQKNSTLINTLSYILQCSQNQILILLSTGS